jgi:hypothetical protein
LEEGGPTAAFNEAQRLFTVSLPQGRTAWMYLNSLFKDDPDIFGIMDWCRKAVIDGKLSQGEANQVYETIKESRHWMTSPWTTLRLVHAVQQPLDGPILKLEEIENGKFKRRIGKMTQSLMG